MTIVDALRRRRVAATLLGATALAAPLVAPVAAHAQYRGEISSIVVDARTGKVLEANQQDLQRFPASLTKLMTLYMTFEALRDRRITLDRAVPVTIHAASMQPSKLGLLPGSYITVEEAILALTTKSANDAAAALGELLGGDEDRFGQMMTLRARALGMSNTTFRNASGLPDPEQVSTAADLGILARHIITDFPDDYHYFSVPGFWFHGRMIPNHDPMLRSYPGADGLKTGYTDAGGCNLVTSAVRGNVRLIGVVLGANNNIQRSNVMTALLNQGFSEDGVPVEAAPPMLLARAQDWVHPDNASTPIRPTYAAAVASPSFRGLSSHAWARAGRLPRHEDVLVADRFVVDQGGALPRGRHRAAWRAAYTRYAGVRHGFRMQAVTSEIAARVRSIRAVHLFGRHHAAHRLVAARKHASNIDAASLDTATSRDG